MKETFVVHPNYDKYQSQIRDLLVRFDEVGENLVVGERNAIKKVALKGKSFTVKRFKNPNIFQALVYQFLRKSKAKRSYEYAIKLIDKQLLTPYPVAYYESYALGLKQSYYICEYLNYDFDFRVLNHHPNWPYRKEILEQFAAFTFRLHENNINFLDHSPGNTLIVEKEEALWDFYLIDLNRMRFETMDFNKRMKNFRRLWLSKTMIHIMAPVYARLYRTSSEKIHERMTFYSRKFQKKVNSKKLRKRRR